MPPFVHEDKNPGDLIRSKDWNLLGNEVLRLGADKISRAGEESLDGPLTIRGALSVGTGSAGGGLSVRGDLGVGTPTSGAAVRVLRRQEDGKDAAHGALVLGTDSPSSGALRLGYYSTYSWLQGQGQQNIAINPHGGNVGIGTAAAPAARLHVEGDLRVTGALSFGNATRQMVNLWGTGYGIGVQASTTYLRTDGSFAFYRGGSHNDAQLNAGGGTVLMTVLSTGNVGIGTADPQARLHVAGGALRLDSGQEVFFPENGQIRSMDNNHRILFRRSENKLELREWGEIVFSPGAKDGNETAKAVLTAAGNLGLGTTAPTARLQVTGDALVSGSLGFGSAVRQMVNLWGTGYGIGVQSGTLYLRSDSNFAFYKGGSHHDGQINPGGGTALATLYPDGTLTAGAFRFGNNSVLQADQGGSIELGANNGIPGTGTPYIDFHFNGVTQDYNTRIINDANGQLTIHAGTFAVRDCFTVSLACADLTIGHPTRRKTPGRAIVDGTTILYLNYDNDWGGGVTYWGALNKASTRDIKEDILGLDAPEAASILRGLEPVRYRLIGDESRAEHLGFVAEEVPDAIASPDHRAINESHIVAVLTRVVKEQQRRLDDITHRLEQALSR